MRWHFNYNLSFCCDLYPLLSVSNSPVHSCLFMIWNFIYWTFCKVHMYFQQRLTNRFFKQTSTNRFSQQTSTNRVFLKKHWQTGIFNKYVLWTNNNKQLCSTNQIQDSQIICRLLFNIYLLYIFIHIIMNHCKKNMYKFYYWTSQCICYNDTQLLKYNK